MRHCRNWKKGKVFLHTIFHDDCRLSNENEVIFLFEGEIIEDSKAFCS